jgi:hypothetical protein
VSICHYELVHLKCLEDSPAIPGDSGAPVVAWIDGERCTIVGMHIAGEGLLTQAIPAWQLFWPGNYSGTLPANSRIDPVPPGD